MSGQTSQWEKYAVFIILGGLAIIGLPIMFLSSESQPEQATVTQSSGSSTSVDQQPQPATPTKAPHNQSAEITEQPKPVDPVVAAEAMYNPGDPPPISDQLFTDASAVQPGQWIVRLGGAIAVTGYGEMEKIELDSWDPINGRIVFATLMMQNHSKKTDNFFFDDFRLQDGQGRTYTEISDSTYTFWREELGFSMRGNDYYPGEVRKEVVAFVVAPDASDFTLTWRFGSIPLSGHKSVSKAADNSATTASALQSYSPKKRTVQAADGYANLRSQPSTEVAAIAQINNGTEVTVLGEQTNSSGQLWYRVEVNGQTGWMFSELLR
jgi:hypothetical protein